MIFARRPQGRVKTRLVPPLTRAQALRLHIACVESTARLAASLPRSVDKWIYLTPTDGRSPRREARLSFPRSLRVRRQRGRGLGARLRAALRDFASDGYRRVVFLGSDSPTLPPALLRRAFASLLKADAVLGPARDGGYYLIGLQLDARPAPDVFRGIAWGTPRAFRQTRTRLRRAGRRVVVLPLWYDVDVAADLRRLARDLKRNRDYSLAPLRAWFRRYGSRRERARRTIQRNG